ERALRRVRRFLSRPHTPLSRPRRAWNARPVLLPCAVGVRPGRALSQCNSTVVHQGEGGQTLAPLVPKLCLGTQVGKLCFLGQPQHFVSCRRMRSGASRPAFPSRAWERGVYYFSPWSFGRAVPSTGSVKCDGYFAQRNTFWRAVWKSVSLALKMLSTYF